jgi:protein TonB
MPEPDAASRKPDRHRDELVPNIASGSPATSSTVEIADEEIAPPALLKAANPVAPPEAVRDFVTGDVKCDALVDAKGKVASANVLSGPAPLRQAALEALRLYQYKPATKNGKAVPAHVEVTLKFWYEP